MKLFKKVAVAVVGFVVVLAGVAMLVLPGPGWPTIFFGLWVWSKEFVWAGKVLAWAHRKYDAAKARVLRKRARPDVRDA